MEEPVLTLSIRALCLVSFVLSALTACGTRVHMRALEPSAVPRATTIKRLSVAKLNRDTLGVAEQLELSLASVRIEGSPYFTVVSREDLARVLSEQRLQSSGLIDSKKAVKIGELLGAQAIISGAVGPAQAQKRVSAKERMECTDPTCKTEKKVKVRCETLNVSLSLQLKLVDVRQGDIIYGHEDQLSRAWSACEGEGSTIPLPDVALRSLSRDLVDRFVQKLSPRYVSYLVKVLTDPDVELSQDALNRFKGGVEFLDAGRYERAQALFEELGGGEGSGSVVVLYNLGLALEAQGQLADALRLYQRADQLTSSPVDEISDALDRCKKRLYDLGEVNRQLKGDE